jgi:hypothetical protein
VETMCDEERGRHSGRDESPDKLPKAAAGASCPPDILLRFTMKPEQIREFFPILQQGFRVTARVGCTLRKLLCEQFAMGSDYVTERITTIFLNGKAIDDLDTAIIRDGTTVALSAAMPGLVGATMRRGSYYSAMRGSITYTDDRLGGEGSIGSVRVKLFNMLLAELGPDFLSRGVVVTASDLTEFLGSRDEQFWRECTETFLNGTPVEPAFLSSGEPFRNCGTVRLTVNFRG